MKQSLNRFSLITVVLFGITILSANNSDAIDPPFDFDIHINTTFAISNILPLINSINLTSRSTVVEPDNAPIIPTTSGEFQIIPHNVQYDMLIEPNTRIFMFGERHTSAAVKNELANNMPTFQTIGITHLGMEMFGTDAQSMLDEYNQGGSNENEIRAYLSEEWGYKEVIDDYMNMMAAARDSGISIVALDIPGHGNHGEIEERNDYMASVIGNILCNNDEARIITLTGAMHIQVDGEGMRNILSSNVYNYNVSSAVFLTRDTQDPTVIPITMPVSMTRSLSTPFLADEYQQNISIMRQISREGLANERFMASSPDFFHQTIIHFP